MLTVQIIGGFTQTEENWNGCLELKERILAHLDDYSSLSVRVRFDPWNANWTEIARQLHLQRLRYQREPFGIVVCAYSWGVGHGLVRFAKQLQRFGLRIDTAVICDGIYRHWWSQYIAQWRAMVGGYEIRVPDNVQNVHGFFQRVSRPMGMKPVSSNTTILSWTQLTYEHVECDDAPEWHDLCAAVARDRATLYVPAKNGTPKGAPQTEATESRLTQ